jgi:hypothetical protein
MILVVTVRKREGHGIRVRVAVVDEAREEGIRMGQAEYLTVEKVNRKVLPLWRDVAQRMAWRFEVRSSFADVPSIR